MYPFHRLLVALKLDDHDAATLRYAAMLSRLYQPEKIYFVHVAETLDIPPSIREKFPQVVRTPEDAVHAAMKEAVKTHFKAAGKHELLFECTEGSASMELLRLIRRHDIDLAVIGRAQQKSEGSGTAEVLARKAPCTVLMVPDGSDVKLRRILVPVDFHNQVTLALENAIDTARRAGDCEVVCLNVYRVPIGFHKSGKSYEQFAQIMKEHAEHDYQQFIAKLDTTGVTLRPAFELAEGSTAAAIHHAMQGISPGLVMMDARGRRAGAGLFLGSTTERMIYRTSVPLMAIKNKGVGMNIVDALLNL